MKKNKINLIYMLILSPMIVFASSSSAIDPGAAIFMEAFVTIHMSVFVLKPLSMLLSEKNDKKLFWTMFIVRVIVLLFFDFFITTMIALFDFFAVFIGAFILVPLTAVIKKKPIDTRSNQVLSSEAITSSKIINMNLNGTVLGAQSLEIKCTKCGNPLKIEEKFCSKCGAPFEGDNVVVSQAKTKPRVIVKQESFDPIHNLPEEKMIEEFINRQLVKAGIDKTTNLIPSPALKRKKILSIIFFILLFAYICLIFFHLAPYVYIIGLIILIIFYKLSRNFNLIKYLKKELKARPNEKVINIVMNTKQTLTTDTSKKMFPIGLCLAIILPLLIFIQPRIFYEKVDNGYAVRFYTFGLTNYTTVTIPETYKNENVVSLRGNTFSNMYFLKEVNLPNTILEIRGQAFKNDLMLSKINIPSNLEYIGGGAFYNCASLTYMEIPDTVTYIGGESFYGASSLRGIKLSNNITEIRGNTFEECTSLESIVIPDKVTRIGGHAFYGDTSLSEVVFTPNSQLTAIGSSAFRMCTSLYSITLPHGVSINERAFKESPTIKYYFEEETNTSNTYTYGENDEVNPEISELIISDEKQGD